MWIRIEGFIINLDNVTNINIGQEYVYISFCHGASNVGPKDSQEIYWNSLAFKKDDIPIDALSSMYQLPMKPKQ